MADSIFSSSLCTIDFLPRIYLRPGFVTPNASSTIEWGSDVVSSAEAINPQREA